MYRGPGAYNAVLTKTPMIHTGTGKLKDCLQSPKSRDNSNAYQKQKVKIVEYPYKGMSYRNTMNISHTVVNNFTYIIVIDRNQTQVLIL